MKRPEYKRFKRHSDLIKHAVRRVILRRSRPEVSDEEFMEYLKKADWLEWTKRKVRK